MRENSSTWEQKRGKAVSILLVFGIAIAGLAMAAPTASAACIHENPGNLGIIVVQTGTGDGTPSDDCTRYVLVRGEQVYP